MSEPHGRPSNGKKTAAIVSGRVCVRSGALGVGIGGPAPVTEFWRAVVRPVARRARAPPGFAPEDAVAVERAELQSVSPFVPNLGFYTV